MARVPLASVLAVALAASACGGGSPSPAAPVSVSPVGATVNGTVLTAESVSTVSVEGTALTAAVDGTRRFQLRAVPTGNVRLVFSGPVDRSAVTLSNVQDQEVIEVDVAISGPTATLQREVRSGVVTPTAVGSVTIKKYTNGQDADQTPGPTIPVGGPVTWTYVVTNGTTGTLESLTVVDDRGVEVACPKILPAPGASITCTGTGIAVAGQYRNVASMTAMSDGRLHVASDASHYFGDTVGGVTIKKYTNGEDADQAPGPTIPVGGPVTWTYVVTNNTRTTLDSLTIVDDRGVEVACPSILPAPGASVTCTGTGVAVAGQYRNVASMTAMSDGRIHIGSDASHYYGGARAESSKVELCHRTGNGSYHLIEVSVNAERAHRAHGDAKVGEPVPDHPGRVFTSSCGLSGS